MAHRNTLMLVMVLSSLTMTFATAKDSSEKRMKSPLKAAALPPATVKPAANAQACNLGELNLENVTLEGQADNDPNRVSLNLSYRFEPGPDYIVNGSRRTSTVIRERMDVGFFRDWLAEGVTGLAQQIHASVPESCSVSRGGTVGAVTSYSPASFSISQGVTKRQCTSFDQPCGPPEVTCTGGDAGAAPSCSLPSCGWDGCRGGGCSGGRLPTLPTCTTTVKMCRVEQKVDVFSAEIRLDYALTLTVSGSPPGQLVEIQKAITRNDISTSQGDLSSFLGGIGLARAFGLNVDNFENGLRQFVNMAIGIGGSSAYFFAIPTSDFVYLPTVRRDQDVSWLQQVNGRPLGLRVHRDMALPTVLACKVRKCLEDSRNARKLLVKSCSLS